MKRHIATIEEQDIGKTMIVRGQGSRLSLKIHLGSAIGRVQPRDVGKRIYIAPGGAQVENDEQMAQRLRLNTLTQ